MDNVGLDQGAREDALLALADAYLSVGLFNKTIKTLRLLDGIQINDDRRNKQWFLEGKAHYKGGRFQNSADALVRIAEELPQVSDEERWYYLSNAYIETGRFEQAESVLNKLPTVSKNRAIAQYNLGLAYIRDRQTNQGAKLLQAMSLINMQDAELSSLHSRSRTALAIAMLDQNEIDMARQVLKGVKYLGVGSSRALLGIGWAWQQQARFDEAISVWGELIQRSPIDPTIQEAKLAYAAILAQIDKPKLSLSYFRKFNDEYDNLAAKLEKVIVIIEEGEFIRALKAYTLDSEDDLFSTIDFTPTSIAVPYLTSLLMRNEFQDYLRHYQLLKYTKRSEHFTQDEKKVFLAALRSHYADTIHVRQDRYSRKRLMSVKSSDELMLWFESVIHTMVTSELSGYKARLDDFRRQARLNQARLYDVIRQQQLKEL